MSEMLALLGFVSHSKQRSKLRAIANGDGGITVYSRGAHTGVPGTSGTAFDLFLNPSRSVLSIGCKTFEDADAKKILKRAKVIK